MAVVSTEERVSCCTLGRIFGFEPAVALALIRNLGSASAVFRLPKDRLQEILGPSLLKFLPLLNECERQRTAAQLDRLARQGCRYVTLQEDGYPPLLGECPDAPPGLYFRGSDAPETVFAARPAVAVVGTRDLSGYGAQWCVRLVRTLAQTREKPLIVSGLALGVDVTAHRSALEEGLPTVAVLPTGIDAVYPRQNQDTADRIAAAPGSALVTDYPPGTAPLRLNFLRRNRIIAGLAGATLLIESRMRGGGRMTARLAASYGRDVYALPGRIDDLRSQGCNDLIRKQIAEAVTDPSTFVSALGFSLGRKRAAVSGPQRIRARYRGERSPEEIETLVRVFQAVAARPDCTAEELALLLGTDLRTVTALTGELECDGFISVDLLQRCAILPEK